MTKGRLSILLLTFALIAGATAVARQNEVSNGSEIRDLAVKFVDALAKQDFAGAVKNFDATMTGAAPPEKLQSIWTSLELQVGSFKRQVGVRSEKAQGYDIAFVTCEFEKSPLDVKVVFNGQKQIAGMFFVPTQSGSKSEAPAPPVKLAPGEKEVIVGSGEWALHGTLSMPQGSGPFPALVLVHGSGPNDRDETIGPNKPFRDLAEGLASRGVAVLRYDKRTREYAAKLAPLKDSITVKEETIDDAIAAVALLRRTEGINPAKVFVLGHSLGGTLIPRIGARDASITGLIVLAGTTRPMEDVILEQVSYIFSLDTANAAKKKSQLEAVRRQVALVKDPGLSVETPSIDLPLGIPAKYWLDLRGYNPAEAARSLKQPMLILQGERDYQVTMEDFAGWKKELSSRPNVEFKTYPRLNHLFIEGEGKSKPAEYGVAGHVATGVIDDIAQWIKRN